MLRMLCGEFIDHRSDRASRIVLVMPVEREDIAEKMVELGRIIDQPGVEVADVPLEQDNADVEDDGVDRLHLIPLAHASKRPRSLPEPLHENRSFKTRRGPMGAPLPDQPWRALKRRLVLLIT